MRRLLTPSVLLVALLALFLGHLADPQALLATRDIPTFHLPLLTALLEASQQGLPSWNPGIHGGQPILSNPNYAAFYPLTWLILLVPVNFSISLLILIHAAIGFLGSHSLARHLGCSTGPALMAGIGFAFSGSALGATNLLPTFCGLAWVPWILLGCLRWFAAGDDGWISKRALLPAAAFSLQIFAGQPIIVVMTGLSATALALFYGERPALRLKRLALVCGITCLLSLAQLVPTYLRMSETLRAGGLQAETALTWSTSPWRLAEIVWPRAWGDPARIDEGLFFGWSLHDRQYPYLLSLYCGQLILLFAVGALSRWKVQYRLAWISMIGGGIFLAVGANNPLFRWLAPVVPFLSQNRFPEKFLLVTASGLVFAAALGWQRVLDARDRDGPALEDFPVALAGLIAAINSAFLLLLWQRPDVGEWFVRAHSAIPPTAEMLQQALAFYRTELLAAIIVTLGSIAVFSLHRWRAVPRWLLVPLTLAVLTADLYYYNHSLMPTVRAADALQPPPELAELPEADRIFTERSLIPAPPVIFRSSRPGPAVFWDQIDNAEPYLGTLWGFQYALHPDFDLMATKPARRALSALETTLGNPEAAQRILGAWNACHLISARSVEEVLQQRREDSAATGLITLFGNPECRDRYRFETDVTFHTSVQEALAADQETDFRQVHWIAHPTLTAPLATDVVASVLEIQEEHAYTRLVYNSDGPGLAPLTISRTYHQGWRAGVDGRSTAVFETSLGMLGILVPPGEHELELRFREPATLPSAVASLFAWIGLFAAGIFSAGRLRGG